MALREIPMAYIKSKDVLLRLKKEGPYSVKDVKPITAKYIELAISGDESLIKELKTKIDPNKMKLIEEVEVKYLEIKDTNEWKELCNAYQKLSEYTRLSRLWTKDNAYSTESYEEIKDILEQSYVSKYETIISNNKYSKFYKERNELKYSKDAYYMAIIKDIEENITMLKEYCLQHPEKIKGYKKR